MKDTHKIFIIEDDHFIRESFAEALLAEGYSVEAFENGVQAIQRLGSEDNPDPCIILLDMMMPVMNGSQFMVEFHKFPVKVFPIPVFLVSASATEKETENMGCMGFVRKPVDVEDLLLIVKKYCARSIK